MNSKIGLGIDLGGTKIAAALFSDEGLISPRKILPIENSKGKQVTKKIIRIVDHFLEWAEAKDLHVSSIGVAIPGIFYADSGKVWRHL